MDSLSDWRASRPWPAAPKICVAGAGGIGGTLAARLGAAGQQVVVHARGASLDAIRRNGIELDDLSGSVRVEVPVSDRAEFGVQDIVFACSKSHAMPALLEAVAPMIGPDTLVIPAINGVPWWYFIGSGGREEGRPVRAVDPEGRLAAMFPAHQLLGCVVYITAEALAPGRVVARNPHRMILGELDGRSRERLRGVCALLADAGIDVRMSPRIRDDVWTKLVGNLTSNPLSVVIGATLQDIYGAAELRELVSAMTDEVLRVAERCGATLDLDPDAFFARAASLGAVRTSMLQDYEKGQGLELAAIGDAVLELAERHRVPMPTTRTILALTRFRAAQRPPQRLEAGRPGPG